MTTVENCYDGQVLRLAIGMSEAKISFEPRQLLIYSHVGFTLVQLQLAENNFALLTSLAKGANKSSSPEEIRDRMEKYYDETMGDIARKLAIYVCDQSIEASLGRIVKFRNKIAHNVFRALSIILENDQKLRDFIKYMHNELIFTAGLLFDLGVKLRHKHPNLTLKSATQIDIGAFRLEGSDQNEPLAQLMSRRFR